METLTVRPQTAGELRFFRELLEKVGAEWSLQRPETLEAKVVRLYEEGHYADWEADWFFSIPREHRVDPFEVSPSGDVYWADRRNIEELGRRSAQAQRDRAEGRTVTLHHAQGDGRLVGLQLMYF